MCICGETFLCREVGALFFVGGEKNFKNYFCWKVFKKGVFLWISAQISTRTWCLPFLFNAYMVGSFLCDESFQRKENRAKVPLKGRKNGANLYSLYKNIFIKALQSVEKRAIMEIRTWITWHKS